MNGYRENIELSFTASQWLAARKRSLRDQIGAMSADERDRLSAFTKNLGEPLSREDLALVLRLANTALVETLQALLNEKLGNANDN